MSESISLSTPFNMAAAWVAARLPYDLAVKTTLGFAKEWYAHNGRYKFGIGQVIDIKKCAISDYGSEPRGWVIVGRAETRFGDTYVVIKTPGGEPETHLKWNAENQFDLAEASRPEQVLMPRGAGYAGQSAVS